MSDRPPRRALFSIWDLVILVALLVILATLAVPRVVHVGPRGQKVGTLNNARQLHLATQNMTLDTVHIGGTGMVWTTPPAIDGRPQPATLTAYLDHLVKANYLTAADLRKLLSAPGISPGNSPPRADNIAFKIFAFDDSAPDAQPFVVTANWEPDVGLTKRMPYGKEGFVVFNKGGDGTVSDNPGDARNPRWFPAGPAVRYEVLE